MDSDLILVIVVITALAFDFTNGFHDTANVVATSISTRRCRRGSPCCSRPCSTSSAPSSRCSRRDDRQRDRRCRSDHAHDRVRGLIGAISWNLITWYYGFPRARRTR